MKTPCFPGGEITISETVYQLLQNKTKVKSCEPISAKGKSEPLTIWRLISISDS
jgi:class 3 adenylate cyclase